MSENEARIKDPSTSGALFSGSWIYFRTKNVDYNFKNILSTKTITKIDFNITGAESNIGDEDNYKRRKGIISYAGTSALTINLTGIVSKSTVGSFASGEEEATVGKLWQMYITPRTYHFWDSRIGSAIMNDPHTDVQNPWITDSAVPVVIDSFGPKSDSESTNKITFSLILREDKE